MRALGMADGGLDTNTRPGRRGDALRLLPGSARKILWLRAAAGGKRQAALRAPEDSAQLVFR